MAERRMFAKTIVLSDAFLDMPSTARCLYFTLGMFADDDGFVNAPRAIMRQCGASDDDMKILIAKKFVLIFDSGVIVIKHWRINNYLQKDRIQPTKYIEEKAQLESDKNGGYRKKTAVYTDVYTENRVILSNSISNNSNNKYSSAPGSVETVEVLSEQDSWFEAFYAKYPKKRDKPAAIKAFKKRCTKQSDFELIMAGLDRWIEAWKGKDPQYIPYPAKWLNAEQYNDDTGTEESGDPLDFLPFR